MDLHKCDIGTILSQGVAAACVHSAADDVVRIRLEVLAKVCTWECRRFYTCRYSIMPRDTVEEATTPAYCISQSVFLTVLS